MAHRIIMPSSEVSLPGKQRGAAGVVAALFLIIVVAIMLQVISNRAGTNIVDTSMQSVGTQAQFLAESGVERAFWNYRKTGTSCNNLGGLAGAGETGVEFVASSGNLVDIVPLQTAPGLCNLTVTANMVSYDVSRTISPILSGNMLIDDNFPDISNWTTSTPGVDTILSDCPSTGPTTTAVDAGATFTYDATENATTGDTTGSINITSPSGKNNEIVGFQNYASTISAPAGSTVDVWINYQKIRAGKPPVTFLIAVDLVDSSDGSIYRAWCDSGAGANVTWSAGGDFAQFVVPAGKNIDIVRLSYHIENASTGNPQASNLFFDNLKVLFTLP